MSTSPKPAGPSVFELADTFVLIGIKESEAEQETLTAEIRGETCAVAFTDEDEARHVLPEDFELYQTVVADFVSQLPDDAGLVIDPDSDHPVYVSSARKEEVVQAGQPFPEGAEVAIGEPEEQPAELVAAIRDHAPEVGGLSKVYSAVYQVTGTDPRLILAYDAGTDVDTSERAAEMILTCAEETEFPGRLMILSIDDIPEAHREWLTENLEPVFTG